jgi:hypothetical protein
MKSALQSYISDNGYPPPATMLSGPPSTNYDAPTSATDARYIASSAILYASLAGKTSFYSTNLTGKAYLNFNLNQVGDPSGTAYVKDPQGFSYGYSTGGLTTNNYPHAGPGFFDFWSADSYDTNSWITSWSN